VHRWFDEVWNQGRESSIDELLADGAVFHGLTGPDGNHVTGAAAFRPFHQQFRGAFPDIHIAIEDVLVDGDKILARCRVTGTHTGPGVLPAVTNKQVDFTGMCLARVRDGKIVEGWNNFDFLALFQQLGLELR
jgi:predicted ester cyclase